MAARITVEDLPDAPEGVISVKLPAREEFTAQEFLAAFSAAYRQRGQKFAAPS